jgi:uncharacterized BrkB/YihY/UPF0761 family membrane protein
MAGHDREEARPCHPGCRRAILADQCPQQAAGIAYRVLFSIAPLAIVLVSIFGLVLQDDGVRQDVVDSIVDALPCRLPAGTTSRMRSRRSPRRPASPGF